DAAAVPESLLNLAAQRAIPVPCVRYMLEEFTRLDPAGELRVGEEVILAPVLLVRPARPGRRGRRHLQLRPRRPGAGGEGALAGPRGAGDDEQAAAHCNPAEVVLRRGTGRAARRAGGRRDRRRSCSG